MSTSRQISGAAVVVVLTALIVAAVVSILSPGWDDRISRDDWAPDVPFEPAVGFSGGSLDIDHEQEAVGRSIMALPQSVQVDEIIARPMTYGEWMTLDHTLTMRDDPTADAANRQRPVWLVVFRTLSPLTVTDMRGGIPDQPIEISTDTFGAAVTSTPRLYADAEGYSTGYYVYMADSGNLKRVGIMSPDADWRWTYEEVAALPSATPAPTSTSVALPPMDELAALNLTRAQLRRVDVAFPGVERIVARKMSLSDWMSLGHNKNPEAMDPEEAVRVVWVVAYETAHDLLADPEFPLKLEDTYDVGSPYSAGPGTPTVPSGGSPDPLVFGWYVFDVVAGDIIQMGVALEEPIATFDEIAALPSPSPYPTALPGTPAITIEMP